MKQLTELNHLLTEFYDKFSSWEDSVVKDTGYSLAQIHTIEVLGNHGPMRMKELAEKLAITTGTLTVQVDKLVRMELIERTPHDNDRRSIVVQLTPAGQALQKQHNKLHLELVNDLTRQIDDAEKLVLVDCLKRINCEF
ncbi:MarR family winged helix-turn-helix transcriptional regulator [Celerinatantimonas sp. YJH-8]|uniref:MarR family winged helix-turn-helix transcriptional regulator n=1 Tax=Celerinatantimonas sp. YJH-8 TaxID=3228714 RepID=UPI0038C19698